MYFTVVKIWVSFKEIYIIMSDLENDSNLFSSDISEQNDLNNLKKYMNLWFWNFVNVI